jgi:hypothetical protein
MILSAPGARFAPSIYIYMFGAIAAPPPSAFSTLVMINPDVPETGAALTVSTTETVCGLFTAPDAMTVIAPL